MEMQKFGWKTVRDLGPVRWTGQSCGFIFIVLAALCLTTACGGGGSGSGSGSTRSPTGTALELPDSIDLSEVEITGESGFNAPAGYDDPGTDYTDQEKMSWLDDTDALEMVNDILGVVADTAYEEFINDGPYKALVQSVGDSKESQGGNSSSSSQTEDLMEITVNVSRQDNSEPMIVKIWVKEEDGPGGQAMLIRGYFEVYKGVSEEYPCGVLEAHFKGNPLNANGNPMPGDPLFVMAMSVTANQDGDVVVQVVDVGEEEEQGFTYEWITKCRVVANSNLTEGNAYVYCAETDWDTQELEEETFYFAYNEDYFKFQDVGTQEEEVLDKNELSHRIFRYKLFDKDTGALIDRSSGFPIRFEEGGYGYIGYWGMWIPYGIDCEDGDTVTRVDNDTQYTLVKVGGKMTLHTRAECLLSDLTDIEISVWDDENSEDLIVAWDGIDSFYKLGIRNWENGQIEYLQTPEVYEFSNEWDGGWCESFIAWLPLGNLTPANGDTVYYHTEQTINPSTATDLDLYYWGFALDAPITQQVIDDAPTNEMNYWNNPPTEKHYFFDASELVLKEDDETGAEVILGDDLNLEGTWFENCGYNMGQLTTDDSYTEENCWEIHQAATFYCWQTGPNEWNQFSTVYDSEGTFASFDAPLRLSYTHLTANDINDDATNDGKQFMLEWDGFDVMIPWYFDEEEEDWTPAFNLKDGVELTEAGSQTAEYVIKGVEEELIMAEVTDPGILTQLETTLPIDDTIPAPTLGYKPSKTANVGAVPANAQLKVIKGEVIE